jgi:hypothetical protein
MRICDHLYNPLAGAETVCVVCGYYGGVPASVFQVQR